MGTSADEAIIIYNHFRWRKDLVEGEYFGDEENNRKKAGLEPAEKAPEPAGDNLTCNLCFDEKPRGEFEALKCNHYLCKDCWKEYIEYNVNSFEESVNNNLLILGDKTREFLFLEMSDGRVQHDCSKFV